ncbi:MAG: L-aspartate oxidase, partial [Acidimicrobiales bacterium]
GVLAGRGRATDPVDAADGVKQLDALQRAMTEGAGVVRSAASLARAASEVASTPARSGPVRDRAGGELANLTTTAAALLAAAAARAETRGAHSRSDFPGADPRWVRRIAVRRGSLQVLPASGSGALPGSDGAGDRATR